MMKTFLSDSPLPRLVLIALLAAAVPFLGGCDDQGPAEEAGEKIDDAIGDAAGEAEEAMDEAEDAMDEVDDEL